MSQQSKAEKVLSRPAPSAADDRGSLQTLQWRHYVLPTLLFMAALALFIPRLNTPRQYIYDEVYHAYTAGQYAAGNRDAYVWYTRATREGAAYEWTHPPLGKLLIAGSILLWDNKPFGWRFAPAIFGAFGVVTTYLLALSLTSQSAVAAVAAGLLLFDGLYFVQSRTGMVDIFGTVFMLGALAAFYRYLTAPPGAIRRPLLLTGTFMGLAMATKWSAAYPSALVGIAALWHFYHQWQSSRRGHLQRRSTGRGRRQARSQLSPSSPVPPVTFTDPLRWIPIGLIVVPLAIYLLSYLPFFLTGQNFSQFIELQRQMFIYHSRLTATHTYQSSWWSWPLTSRPVWYYVGCSDATVANIYANGNPLLYWASPPSVTWLIFRWWGERNQALIVFLIGFFGQGLPWALVPRIAFLYHFLPVVPFGCLAVAIALADLWQGRSGWRIAAIVYIGLVVNAFVFFYPIYSAVPLSHMPSRYGSGSIAGGNYTKAKVGPTC